MTPRAIMGAAPSLALWDVGSDSGVAVISGHRGARRMVARDEAAASLTAVGEAELHRVATVLRDQTMQVMAAANLYLSVLRENHGYDEGGDALVRVEAATTEAVEHLRRLIVDLRLPELGDIGFVDALRTALEALERDGAVRRWNLAGRFAQEPDLARQIVLYRVAQEALRNVALHAEAAGVDAEVAEVNGGYLVGIRDDGNGFRPRSPEKAAQSGIETMRRRIELLNGWWRLTSKPGAGTFVQFWLPGSGRHAGA